MIKDEFIVIHHALHSDQCVVTVNSIDYPILTASNGCRYVTFQGVQIMQQNPHKMSSYAKRARDGERLTWAMTQPTWTLIDDAVISSLSPKQEALPKTADNVSTKLTEPGPTTDITKRIAGAGDYRVTRNFWRQKS